MIRRGSSPAGASLIRSTLSEQFFSLSFLALVILDGQEETLAHSAYVFL